MTVRAKICGLSTAETVTAAIGAGASAIGFAFYEPSPRYVTPARAAALVPTAEHVDVVGLFVDPDDALIDAVLEHLPLDLLQLHGAETPARVAEIRLRFGRPVMKAVKVAEPDDLGAVETYDDVADWLLFDAKAPKNMVDALPGGNGVPFDWALFHGRTWQANWMLSGGLTAENLAAAVAATGAGWVDVSSGVETAPGKKSVARIDAFMQQVNRL